MVQQASPGFNEPERQPQRRRKALSPAATSRSPLDRLIECTTPRATFTVLLELGFWPIALYPQGVMIPGRKKIAEGKEPFGPRWGEERWTIARWDEAARRHSNLGVGICLGPGRGPGDSWLFDVEGDGPEAEESRAKLYGGEVVDSLRWGSVRGGHQILIASVERLAEIIPGLKSFEVKKGASPGVYKPPSLPGLELRLGGYKDDPARTIKQVHSAIPPTIGTDGTPRRWSAGSHVLPAPEAFYVGLAAIRAPQGPACKPDTQPGRRKPRSQQRETMTADGRWSAAALAEEWGKMASCAPGGRNDQLNRAAYSLGQLVGGGYFSRAFIEAELRSAAMRADLDNAEIAGTLKSGLEAGMANPRRRPERASSPTNRLRVVAGEQAGPEGGAPLESDDDPYRLAGLILDDSLRHHDGLRLRRWNGQWVFWDGRSWITRPDEEVHNEAGLRIKREFDRLARVSGLSPLPVTTNIVGNSIAALRSLTSLSTIDCGHQPNWLGPYEPGEDLPNPEDLLPASNVLVDLTAHGQGAPCTLALTPRFFSANTLGYPFDPQAPSPDRWLKFLNEVWPDDPESIATLQEWFGYLLTPDTRQQKILMMIGPKRCGKGTIFRVLEAIVGGSNVAHTTLTKMAQHFGMESFIGKSLVILPDVRISHRVDVQVVVEQLLSVSGEDGQTIGRKHVGDWQGKLSVRFVLGSNILPKLDDSSGAMAGRLILLPMSQTFHGREDLNLTSSLLLEKTGILLWAIDGWKRLRERGYFVQPGSASDLVEDFESLLSPVGEFVAEECEVGPQCSSLNEEMFNRWKQWCQRHNREHIGTEQDFGRHLRACVPSLKPSRRREGERQRPTRRGIGLRETHNF